jgi:hypothetical protein
MLNNKRVKCLHNGCRWQGDLSDLIGHVNGCPHVNYSCTLCNQELSVEQAPGHLDQCPENQVQCGAGCGKMMQKRAAPAHAAECPNRTVSCELSAMGCAVQGTPAQLEWHRTDPATMHYHMQLMMQRILQLEARQGR